MRTIKLVARIAKSTDKDIQTVFVANRYDKRSNIGDLILKKLEKMHPSHESTGETFGILSGVPVRQGFKEMFTYGGVPTGTAKKEVNSFIDHLRI